MAIEVMYSLLIAEDDLQARGVIAVAFRQNNFDVKEAGNGVEAIPVLRQNRPHVLITDLEMPIMDGYELLRITHSFFPETGVVVLSGTCNSAQTSSADLMDAVYDKGTYQISELIDCVTDLAKKYPVRPRVDMGTLSASWISRDDATRIGIACNSCEQFFFLGPQSVPTVAGVHIVSCERCHGEITYLLEQDTLQRSRATA